MINTIQITGEPDTHPEHPVHDARELAEGKLVASLDVKSHFTKVFDIMDEEARSEYDSLYVELAAKTKSGKAYILANSRDTLTREDGSTGWFRYLEWIEYDVSEVLGA